LDTNIGGETEVAAIDPVASMQAIDNPHLKTTAERDSIVPTSILSASSQVPGCTRRGCDNFGNQH
jgi:hypothetical protein